MMRKNNITIWGVFLALIIMACDTDHLMYDTDQKSTIYFDREVKKDTVFFTFTYQQGNECNYNIPVRVMGAPVDEVRDFIVDVVKDSTTAIEGTHYEFYNLKIPANQVTGVLTIKFKRDPGLMNKRFFLCVNFGENKNFRPMVNDSFRIAISDGQYPQPLWWRDLELGAYSPGLFERILNKYWELETTRPIEYTDFEAKYGRFLETAVDRFYKNDHPAIWVKYVLKPVYEYYQQNPEEGVNMPNPDTFIR